MMDLTLAFEDSTPFRLTVDQYQALDEAGAFDEQNGRVELIEGMIVCMNSQTVAHVVVTNELGFRLREKLQALGSAFQAYVNPTVTVRPHNAPDPDIAVAMRPTSGRYFDVSGVALLVEVARTTLRKDLKIKRDIYARAGVPEYWVVDVNKTEVHRFWKAQNGVYEQEKPIPLAGELRSLTMSELSINGAGIL